MEVKPPSVMTAAQLPQLVYEVIERMGALRKEGAQSLEPKDFTININVVQIHLDNGVQTLTVLEEGATMNRNSSVDARGATISAPVTTGDHNTVTSTTTVGQSPELQKRLDELAQLVEVLATKLPPEKAKEVRQDLDTLTDQAKSDAPRQKWYELSADGLMEAANTVADMASPVTKAVKAVLSLITGAA